MKSYRILCPLSKECHWRSETVRRTVRVRGAASIGGGIPIKEDITRIRKSGSLTIERQIIEQCQCNRLVPSLASESLINRIVIFHEHHGLVVSAIGCLRQENAKRRCN